MWIHWNNRAELEVACICCPSGRTSLLPSITRTTLSISPRSGFVLRTEVNLPLRSKPLLPGISSILVFVSCTMDKALARGKPAFLSLVIDPGRNERWQWIKARSPGWVSLFSKAWISLMATKESLSSCLTTCSISSRCSAYHEFLS